MNQSKIKYFIKSNTVLNLEITIHKKNENYVEKIF
jgi:hypothetical protein